MARRRQGAILGLSVLALLALLPRAPAEDPPQGAAVLEREGIEHYERGRYHEAVLAFRAALEKLEPRSPDAGLVRERLSRSLSAHGVELLNAGESRAASKAFEEALGHHEDFYAHFGLGYLELVRLEDTTAAQHLDRALLLEPTYARTHKLLAVLDYRAGRTRSALDRIEKACGLDAADTEARSLRERWMTEARHSRDFVEIRRGATVLRAHPAIPRARIERVLSLLAKVRRQVAEALAADDSRPLTVVLFPEKEFHRATGSQHWVGGFYDGQLKIPFPDEEGPRDVEALEGTLRHELAHVAIRELCAECPNWLNEGIAQHLEDGTRRLAVEKVLREGGAARTLLRDAPVRLWEVADEGVARRTYLEGLAFVEYLVARYHAFRLPLLLEAISAEGSLSRAFETTFGLPLDELEDRWWQEFTAAEEARGPGEG
jgi:Flp pilus assembly protein TadD